MDAMLTYQSPRTAASSDEGSGDGGYGDCDNEWGIAARGPEWENYTIVRCLGRGSQGSAYLCRQKRRTPLCAAEDGSVVIKAVYCGGMDEKELSRAMMEVSILGGLAHENVVKYYDYFMDEAGMLCTAMEYAGGGDLGGLIRDNKRAGVATPSEAVFDAGRQLLRALRYLRGRRVLHRDVKPENILVAAGGLLRLGDFGVARILEVDQPGAATFTGTPYYISPELCLGEPYDFAADVWSLGVTLYELATHAHPFTGSNLLAIVNSITDGAYAPIPKGMHTQAVVTLITTLLTPDPTERPTAAETLRWYFPASEQEGEEEEDGAAAGEAAAASRDDDDDDGARPSSPAASVASSAPDLRWLDGRARGSAADGELERKIRAKAEALQRKRLLLHRKRRAAAVVAAADARPAAAAAASAAAADDDESGPSSSAAALVKARFLTCVYERKANEGRRTRNADGYREARKMMGHILSDEEDAVSGQSSSDDDDDDVGGSGEVDSLHQATRDLFASKASRQCLRSIKKVMNETVRRRAELGIDEDDDSSSTTSTTTASNTTELGAEEEAEEDEVDTESEGEEGDAGEHKLDADCVQMVLRLGDGGDGDGGGSPSTPEKASGFRIRNVAEGEEHTRLLAGAEELLGSERGGGGGGQKAYALYWVDGDGDRVRILTEEDTRHAVEAYWAGVEMTMEVLVVAV